MDHNSSAWFVWLKLIASLIVIVLSSQFFSSIFNLPIKIGFLQNEFFFVVFFLAVALSLFAHTKDRRVKPQGTSASGNLREVSSLVFKISLGLLVLELVIVFWRTLML